MLEVTSLADHCLSSAKAKGCGDYLTFCWTDEIVVTFLFLFHIMKKNLTLKLFLVFEMNRRYVEISCQSLNEE